MPLEKSVFQRSNTNEGHIKIKLAKLDGITKVKFVLYDISKGLIPIQELELNVSSTSLESSITASGGWYELKVDFINKLGQKTTEFVKNVGIGEVFIVAGQSNVQRNGPPPKDDRVVAAYFKEDKANQPDFISLNTKMYRPWAWPSPPGTSFLGALGDALVDRFQVPILFFSAAVGGTSSGDWFQSTLNNSTPYYYIDIALQKYVPTLGLRGILWFQGESNSLNWSYNPEKEQYKKEVEQLVNQSRKRIGFDKLSWVVSLTSWNKAGVTPGDLNDPNADEFRNKTREGQQLLIDSDQYIFPGPDTDVLEGYNNSPLRIDGVHFTEKGFSEVGKLWAGALNSQYFNGSTPYITFKPTFIQKVSQNISFEEWSPPSDCEWKDLPKPINQAIPLHYSILEGEAEIKGNQIRLKGKSGTLKILIQNEGNDSFYGFSQTLTYDVDPFLNKAKIIDQNWVFEKNTFTSIKATCSVGIPKWYLDKSLSDLYFTGEELLTIIDKNQRFYLVCEEVSCKTEPVQLALLLKDCHDNFNRSRDRKMTNYNLKGIHQTKLSLLDREEIVENKLPSDNPVSFTLRSEGHVTIEFPECQINK